MPARSAERRCGVPHIWSIRIIRMELVVGIAGHFCWADSRDLLTFQSFDLGRLIGWCNTFRCN